MCMYLVRRVGGVLDRGGKVGVKGQRVDIRRLGKGRKRVCHAGESHELIAGGGLGGHCRY
jgi:hypothetical protein